MRPNARDSPRSALHDPAALAQRRGQIVGRLRAYVQFDQADRLPRRVLDPDVLDVDPGRTGRGEKRRELAGPVGEHHRNRLIARRRRAVLARDPADAVVAAVRASGLAEYRRHHVGHAIGLEPYEPPLLAPGDDTDLEAGMVLRVEAPYYMIGWGGLNLMETVLVMRKGARVMNRSARGLVLLD